MRIGQQLRMLDVEPIVDPVPDDDDPRPAPVERRPIPRSGAGADPAGSGTTEPAAGPAHLPDPRPGT
jgi:hypothetical protein